MPRELGLLRHGDAEAGEGVPDADRRLTATGEAQAIAAGRALARVGLEFAAALTSPRVRAARTARLACEPLGIEPVVHEPLSGGFDRDEALVLVGGQDDGARVLAVGHEPDFSQTVRDLTGARIDLGKGGLAAVAVEGGGAELIVLLRAHELEVLGAGA
jgi:phosphohistidine phosphatase